jgi:hypothetical protein
MPSLIPQQKAISSAQTAVKACNDIVKSLTTLIQIRQQVQLGQIDMSAFDSVSPELRANCEHFDSSMFNDMLNQIEDVYTNRMLNISQISNNK